MKIYIEMIFYSNPFHHPDPCGRCTVRLWDSEPVGSGRVEGADQAEDGRGDAVERHQNLDGQSGMHRRRRRLRME